MKKIVKENLNESSYPPSEKSIIKKGLRDELKSACKLFSVNLDDEEIYDILMDLADDYGDEFY